MQNELEATYYPVNIDKLRKKLTNVEAKLIKPEFVQTRKVFDLNPDIFNLENIDINNDTITFSEGRFFEVSDRKEFDKFLETVGRMRSEANPGYIRVRNEADRTTLTYKRVVNNEITGTFEIEIVVSDFDAVAEFLTQIGCIEKSYQETKRELWSIGKVEIMIDTWPHLEPLVEIEGPHESEVKNISELLGFDYKLAIFGGADEIYHNVYPNFSKEEINQIPFLRFETANPFTNGNEEGFS